VLAIIISFKSEAKIVKNLIVIYFFYKYNAPLERDRLVGYSLATNITLLRSGIDLSRFHSSEKLPIFHYSLFILHSSLFTQNRRFCRVRWKPGKPAKRTSDVMQGVKERTCELLLRPCSHTDGRCGLEGVHRRRVGWIVLLESAGTPK
jgi:hypothetical protein